MTRTIETDVLVIGGGAAGHAAALSAAEAGAKVMQLYKGPAVTAISTGFLTFPVEERVGRAELEPILNETVGKGLSDPALMARFLEDGPGEIAALLKKYDIVTDEAPRGLRARRAKHKSGRELIGEDYSVAGVRDMTAVVMEFSATHGTSLFSGLLKAVKATPGIDRVQGQALEILPAGPRVAALIEGAPASISAGAIILATGGLQGFYEFTDNPPSILGDGHAMALEAGAELIDMEFIQFYPLALAEEGAPAIFIYPDFPEGGRVVNDKDEDVIAKHFGGDGTLGSFDNWDHLSIAVQQEVRDGQNVYMDFTATDPEAWTENSLTGVFLRRYVGDDFLTRRIRAMPIAHYTIGGVRANAEAETAVPGLYAVGEVAGGMHGANRHGGISLAEGVTFGAIAGRNAARRAKDHRHPAAANYLPPGQTDGATLDFDAALQPLRHLCQMHLGPLRDGADLEALGETLAEARDKAESYGWSDLGGYAEVLRYRRIIDVMDAMRRFMLRRTETRGVHARADYRGSDEAWRRKQAMSLGPDGRPRFEDVVV